MNASGELPRYSEEAFFFELGADRLFGFLHRPIGPPRAGIVLCHAFAEEKLWSHRVYVSFARDAAAQGYVVLRFDMRGEGDSDCEFEQTTIDTRIEDTVRALQVLRERVPSLESIALVGHRLGGSIAAAAMLRGTGVADALVVWDPLFSGEEYLLQLLRSNLATQMATDGKILRNREMLLAAALQGEVVTVDGYGLTGPLVRGLQALNWRTEAGVVRQPVLLAEVAVADRVDPTAAAALLRDVWPTLTCEVVGEPPFWRETRQFHQRAASFTRVTLDWIGSLP